MENNGFSRSYKNLSDRHFEKKCELRYGHFCGFYETQIFILSPIDF